MKFMTTVATGTLEQMAIAHFLENGSYDRHLRKLRTAFQNQVSLTTQAIIKYFPEGTKITRPSGGFVLWVELPDGIKALDVHKKALESKISIAPGNIFSSHDKYQNFIRVSCGLPWGDVIEKAIIKLGEIAKSLRIAK